MRLAIKLLNSESTVNKLEYKKYIGIARGETPDVLVQLVDEDQGGQRYIPAAGATVQFQVPRLEVQTPGPYNTRVVNDYSIDRAAIQAFPGDGSIWKITLTDAESAQLVSGLLRVVVTEGTVKKIATHAHAFKVSQ